VTYVGAKESAVANGLLFVVENTDQLIIAAQIGEYDVGLLQLGQEVIVKTDSTGDMQFRGHVSNIAPAAVKDAGGNTIESSNVQFDAEISLLEKDTAIKIGMNARLTIIFENKSDVFSVPYDAVAVEADGSNCIYVAEETNDDSQVAYRKINVETGLTTDMAVEIKSSELEAGMEVIVNPEAFILK
jgi:multidrug efflux pump subunit AcrA (membrane-fusion protein)